jgi:predicted esterase
MEIALRLPFAIGGIVPIAGFIKFKDALANEATEESKNTPVLLLHGNQDEIIHVTASEKAHEFFKERSNPVYFKRYDGGHKIPKRTGPIVNNFISDSFNFFEVNSSEFVKFK